MGETVGSRKWGKGCWLATGWLLGWTTFSHADPPLPACTSSITPLAPVCPITRPLLLAAPCPASAPGSLPPANSPSNHGPCVRGYAPDHDVKKSSGRSAVRHTVERERWAGAEAAHRAPEPTRGPGEPVGWGCESRGQPQLREMETCGDSRKKRVWRGESGRSRAGGGKMRS